jgi:hypothetical protein
MRLLVSLLQLELGHLVVQHHAPLQYFVDFALLCHFFHLLLMLLLLLLLLLPLFVTNFVKNGYGHLHLIMNPHVQLRGPYEIDWRQLASEIRADLLALLQSDLDFMSAETARDQCYHTCRIL